MGKFTRMPKMKTTEPSVDEVKMKKGGKATKMAMGGDPRMAAMPAQQDPRMMAAMKQRAMMSRQPAAAAQPPMMMRKEGGKMDKSQDKAMIKKAFKQHDMQEHKGGKGTSLKLAKGGKAKRMADGGMGGGESPSGMGGQGGANRGAMSRPGRGMGAARPMPAARPSPRPMGGPNSYAPEDRGGMGGGAGMKKGGKVSRYAEGGSIDDEEDDTSALTEYTPPKSMPSRPVSKTPTASKPAAKRPSSNYSNEGRYKSAPAETDETKMSVSDRLKASRAKSRSGTTDTRSVSDRIRSALGFAKGGSVGSFRSSANGIAQRGKTRGKMC